MDGLAYAYMPLYPLLLLLGNVFINNSQLTAFILMLFFLLTTVMVSFFLISKLFSPSLAFKSVFLILAFPFSIFFRSYYPESLQLTMLVFLGYLFVKKRFLLSSLIICLLTLAKGTNIIFIPILGYLLLKAKCSKKHLLTYLFLSSLGVIIWSIYCFSQTSDPFFFITSQQAWRGNIPLFGSLVQIISSPFDPLHSFQRSKLDVGVTLVTLVLLIASFRKLKRELWLISFGLWLMPVLSGSLMSMVRLQSISYPLFIFLASKLNRITFPLVATVFTILLIIVSVYFINWHWIG